MKSRQHVEKHNQAEEGEYHRVEVGDRLRDGEHRGKQRDQEQMFRSVGGETGFKIGNNTLHSNRSRPFSMPIS